MLSDVILKDLHYPKEGKVHNFPQVEFKLADFDLLRHPLPKGVWLLGFKPQTSLKAWHQFRESTFAYPDEVTAKGSTKSFAALLEAMADREVMAVCLLVRSPTSEPRMVALIPQLEVVTEDGQQYLPPGMHVIYLPYRDDVRFPEEDEDFTGSSRILPSPNNLDAARELVSNLQIPEFDSTTLPNPHLQKYYSILEAEALQEELPGKDPQDETLPDSDVLQVSEESIHAFKVSVAGPTGNIDDLEEPNPKKRGGHGPARQSGKKLRDNTDLPRDSNGNLDLASLCVADLKEYAKFYGLSRVGKKADLIARIEAHVNRLES